MTRVVFHLLMLFVGIVTIHAQIEYLDAPVTTSTSSTCSVECGIGCLKETITPTRKTLRKCTTKTGPQNYISQCGYMGTTQCTRYKIATYKHCVSVRVTYNKIRVTCNSTCTVHEGNVFSPDALG